MGALLLAGLGLITPAPAAAQAPPVVPTQWIAKQFTEGLGRAPTPAEWQTWVTHFTNQGCTTESLRAMTRSVFGSTEFASRYAATDHAGRVIALVRAAYSHEPNSNDWSNLYPSLANGSRTWAATVDQVFLWIFDPWVRPSVCDAAQPGYGFDAAVPLDVKNLVGSGASRSQAQLQTALDNARAGCGTVALAPYETVRIGAGASPTLTVPSCVTLTTTGGPAGTAYARQGRLVADVALNAAPCVGASCVTEVVRIDNGGNLRNVWVSGGAGATGIARTPLALVGVRSGQTSTRVLDNRLSDPLSNGSALRLEGYGTSGPDTPEVECSGRQAERNLVTGYASKYEQTRTGQARWVDGIAVFCEQAVVHDNDVVDVTDVGIAAYGVWNAKVGNTTIFGPIDARRTQRSTVTANTVLSAGSSAQIALAADGTGECRVQDTGPPVACIEFSHDRTGQPAIRDFNGTSFDGNTFWTGARTFFKIGLMIGSKARWGDNGPMATSGSFTNNTTGGITTNVQTGIMASGMIDVLLTGNTAAYNDANRSPGISENACRVGDVIFGYYRSSFRSGSQAGVVDVFNNNTCLTPPLPAGGFEPITVNGSRLQGAVSGAPFLANGLSQNLSVDAAGLDDLRTFRQMGITTVRAHLQFTDVMASCTAAKPAALAELDLLTQRLEETGLYLQLVGLSSWEGDHGDVEAGFGCYAGPSVTTQQRWDAQAAFWRAVAGRVAGSPTVLSLDLMNEPMVPGNPVGCWLPKVTNPGQGPCDPLEEDNMPTFSQYITRDLNGESPATVGDRWLGQMVTAIRDVDDDHPITLGCFGWTTCAGLSPTQQATHLDYLSPHLYPKNCAQKAVNWLGEVETDNSILTRCSFGSNIGTGQIRLEYNGTLVWTNPDGTTRPYTFTGSGDGLTEELQQLTGWAAAGTPVVVGEVATLFGGDVERLTRTTLADGRTDGWLAIFGDGLTLSQARTSNVFEYINARLIQRLVRETAPCGNCGP